MFRRKLHRPSLKITRHADPCQAGNFTFEVWSPFTGNYQVVASIEDGMRRVDQLADLIYQMWLQRHPTQDALADARHRQRRYRRMGRVPRQRDDVPQL
jgi:hypothetical protein